MSLELTLKSTIYRLKGISLFGELLLIRYCFSIFVKFNFVKFQHLIIIYLYLYICMLQISALLVFQLRPNSTQDEM